MLPEAAVITTEEKTLILAIDPGKEKLGLAIIGITGDILTHQVVPKEDFQKALINNLSDRQVHFIAIGDGTGAEFVHDVIKRNHPDMLEKIVVVQEINTTLEARELAWTTNPPIGIFRLLPKIFWPSPKDIDAWAAVIIGRRAISKLVSDGKI